MSATSLPLRFHAGLLALLLLTPAAGSCASSQENLLSNPGFEKAAAATGAIPGWSSSNASPYGPNVPPGKTYAPSKARMELDFDVKRAGRASAKLTGLSKVDRATLAARATGAVPGAKYYVSAWVKSAGVAEYTELRMSAADLIWDAFATPEANTDWTRHWAVVKAPEKASGFRITLWANRLCGTVWFDDVVVRPATSEDERAWRAKFWIVKLKNLCVETALADRGTPRAVIVCPRDPAYADLAKRLAAEVADATAARLPIKHPADVTPEDRRTRHLICLGDMSNNDLLATLYCQQHILTDKSYPGPGGFELRTVHNPWGHERNVILVGGSDPTGVADALEALLEHVRPGRTLKLPRLMLVKLPGAQPPKPADPASARSYADRYYKTKLKALLGYAMQMGSQYSTKLLPYRHGDRYFRTGDEQSLLIFRELMLKVVDVFEEAPRPCCLEDLWTPVITWDRVEEHPAFSDDERVAVTNFFVAAARRAFSRQGKRWRSHRDILWGHPLDHALSVLFAAEYLWRHYRFPEAKEWIDVIAPILSRNAEAVLMPIDEFKYQTYSMRFALHSSLTRGDFEYFRNNNARRFANRTVTYLDNVKGVWGNTAWLFKACAWYYGDARLAWLARGLGESKWGKDEPEQGPFATGMTPIEPVDLLGLTLAPIDQCFYTHAPTNYGDSRPELNVPRSRAFHAVSFRSGFDPNSQFARVDGCSRGLHRRHDGAALTWFGQRGRTFIGPGGPYEHIAPRFQNAVSVVRDGQSERIPAYAALATCADLGQVAFIRAEVNDYCGMDWSRSLVCVRGQYVLLFDDLICRKPGEVALRCHFMVDGKAHLSGRLITAIQQGVACFVENADTSTLRLDKTADYVLKTVPTQSHFLRQSTTAALSRGHGYAFVNLLSCGDAGTRPAYSVGKRLARSVALVGRACIGAPRRVFRANRLLVEADQFYFDRRTLAIANGTAFRCDGAVTADKPVCLALDVRSGAGIVFSDAEVNLALPGSAESILLDGERVPFQQRSGQVRFSVPRGRHVIELRGWSAALAKCLDSAVRDAAGARPYGAARPTPKPLPRKRLRLVWRWEPVENVLGMRNIAPEAKAASPNDVFVGRGPGRAIDGVAGDDFSRHGWTACNCCDGKTPAVLELAWPSPVRIEGAVLHWSAAEPHLFSRGYVLSYWRRGKWERVVSVEGNKATRREHRFPQPVVTSRFQFLCPVGSGSWSGRNYLQEIEVLGGCPVTAASRSQPAPGKTWPKDEEVVVSVRLGAPRRITGVNIERLDAASVSLAAAAEHGQEYRTLCRERTAGRTHVAIAVTHSAPLQGLRLRFSPRPGSAVQLGGLEIMGTLPSHREPRNELTCLAVGDLEGDGQADIVVGSKNHAVYALDSSGALKWQFAARARVNALCVADLDGDGKQEVAVGSDNDLCVLEEGAKKRWSFKGPIVNGLAPRVTCLCAADLDNDGKLDLVAGSKNYHYYAFNRAGRMLWKYYRMGSEATAVGAADLDRDRDVEILAGCYYFWSQALDHKGKRMWDIKSELPAVTAVCMADVEGDGPKEAVYGVGEHVRVCDAAGRVKWQRNVGDYAHAIAVADLNRDRRPEVVVASSSFCVYVFDSAGREVWRRNLGAEVRALCVADLDGDGRLEVIAGAEDNGVHVFGHDGAPVASFDTGGYVTDLAAMDLNRDGRKDVAAACRDGAVYLLSLE